MKKLFVGQMRDGARIEDVFLVVSRTVASTRGGATYLRIRLADKTGEVDAVKWEATESEISRLVEDDYVLIHGSVNTYRGNLQVTVDSFQRWGEAVDPADFMRCSANDPDQMMAELLDLLGEVTQPHLRQLLDSFFGDNSFALKFKQAPAARSVHHAYVSGLLEHTLGVVKACGTLADLYPSIDKDLLITAAALHDAGKIEEFEWNGSIKYSEAGHLVGHVVGGAMMVKQVAESIEGFDPLLSLVLQHMILAHHGQHDYGSPKLPQCLEAIMLHYADDLDAKAAILKQAIDESRANGENSLFTKNHHMLNRAIFKGIPREMGQAEESSEREEINLDLFAVDSDYDPFADN